MTDKAILVVNTNQVLSNASRQSIMAAADRWGAAYIEVGESNYPWHHATLKMEAFSLCPDFERIFILDSDTIIREDAPNIFNVAPVECYVAVKNQQPHFSGAYQEPNVRLARMQIESILSTGLVPREKIDVEYLSRNFFNSGVTVVSRTHHAQTLEFASTLFRSAKCMGWWDQIPLNVSVQLHHGGYTDIGSMWNFMFPSQFSSMTAYIYHFAGDPTRYEKLDGRVNWQV